MRDALDVYIHFNYLGTPLKNIFLLKKAIFLLIYSFAVVPLIIYADYENLIGVFDTISSVKQCVHSSWFCKVHIYYAVLIHFHFVLRLRQGHMLPVCHRAVGATIVFKIFYLPQENT